MNKNLKKLSKNIYLFPFLCGFFYFVVIFIKVPVVEDRWLEKVAYYDLQDTWRVLFTQVRWMQRYNARVFSNLFSMLFDKNIYVRAVLNAFMLMAFCYLSSFGFREYPEKDSHKQVFLSLLSVALIALVSWNIKAEVYLYAATLYLSSALVVLVMFVLLFRCFYRKQSNPKDYTVLCIFQLATLLWLENVSLVLAGVCTLNVLTLYLREHKINKRALVNMVISMIGLSIMYIDARIVVSGRFGNGAIAIENFDYSNIPLFVYNNIYVMLTLVLLVNYIFHQVFEKGKVRMLAGIFLNILSVAALVLVLKNIYEIISAELRVEVPYGWLPFRRQAIDDFFNSVDKLYFIMLVPAALVFIAILIIVLYRLGRIYEGVAILTAILLNFAFQSMYYVGAGRIESLTVFCIISLTLLLAGDIEPEVKNSVKKYGFRTIVAGIIILALIQFDSLHMFVHT